MKLFYSPGTCSLAPHIVLHEVGAAFTLVKVDITRHLTDDQADYYRINPKGQVPLLQLDDGQTLTEGPVIAQFIAEQACADNLLPVVGQPARYQVLAWQNYITSELHKSFSPLFNAGFDATAKRLHAELLAKKYAWVNSQLASQPFLTGPQFTVADAYLFAVTRWTGHVGLDISGLDHLQEFMTRVGERPSVRAALQTEGLAG